MHDGAMPMDFYVWLIRNGKDAVLVDTGFSEASSNKRGRHFIRQPQETIEQLGVAPSAIKNLILTHLHYDHAGATQIYDRARIHLQDAEMQYATGRCMCHRSLNHFFAVEDVQNIVGRVFAGDVKFHNGGADILPGVRVELVGGHTAGLQVVRVRTKRGWVVLASDASHYYQNLEQQNPFPAVHNTGDMMDAYALIRSLADSAEHIIPGHDPEVGRRYPKVPGVDAFMLHEPPRAQHG
jgi:glyoxylase-like metal-dependent hydrolase (beta-lactamase superfamily II)